MSSKRGLPCDGKFCLVIIFLILFFDLFYRIATTMIGVLVLPFMTVLMGRTSAQTLTRLLHGTIFTEKGFLLVAGANNFHLTVGIQIPMLPRELQLRTNPCTNISGPATLFCEKVSTLLNQQEMECQRTVPITVAPDSAVVATPTIYTMWPPVMPTLVTPSQDVFFQRCHS